LADTAFKALADDLDQFLSENKPKRIELPPPVREQDDTAVTARALLDFVLSRAPQDMTAEDIGGAIGLGVESLAEELGYSPDELMSAVETYLGSMLRTAKALSSAPAE